MNAKELLKHNPVVPVAVATDPFATVRDLEALRKGGIRIAEITFRTDCAEEALRAAVEKLPDMLIGAGTVLSKEQAERAVSAGAAFVVSPGLSAAVAAYCAEKNIPYIPGCVTPTEIMAAMDLGLTTLKFFPANLYGGPEGLRALAAPFPGIKFLPTGGIDETSVGAYLACDCVAAVGGSFMLRGDIAANCRKISQWL